MADETFSPETHRFAEPRYFDDFRVGERFYRGTSTISEWASASTSRPAP